LDGTVAAGLDVAVRVGGKYTSVFVGLFTAMAVVVTSDTVVGAGDAKRVLVIAGGGVPVTKDAPGVRKTWIQLGWVKMEESTASMSSSGLGVRKSLFGSR
jgi:hypothetical protein